MPSGAGDVTSPGRHCNVREEVRQVVQQKAIVILMTFIVGLLEPCYNGFMNYQLRLSIPIRLGTFFVNVK